ncbi:hypothetical protein [Sorangium sp. So ce1182]|uniref:hypothetical protein n=1 Tax=Sorangium sp. So ce1182 TaxID=3133334 RepID=UPI003F5F9EDC
MVDNEWGVTKYPFVPGHEIAGTVAPSTGSRWSASEASATSRCSAWRDGAAR